MQSVAIIGAQWGDEGKGKITDYFAQKSDLVVRFQGGNNAGHTIIVGDRKIVLHIVPSGILNSHCLSIVGHGVVLDPEVFKKEIDTLVQSGIKIDPSHLLVSQNCTVITSYNKILDVARESMGKTKIGTTGRGIGPAYEDKVARRGIKVKDLLNRDVLIKRLEENLTEKQALFTHLYHVEFPPIEEEFERLLKLGQFLAPMVADTFTVLDQAFGEGKKILYEGAQGVLLDIDYGTYPFVTSSNTSFGGIYTGAGVPGRYVDEVVGIVKAYTTRVGEGPFPTELFCETGEKIQVGGNEFGATTGRKRRCGWLDLPMLKYSVKTANLTSIALTKLDVLSLIDELKICYAYEYEGKTLDCAFPGLDMDKVRPIFRTLKPFKDNFTSDKLSSELQEYVKIIENFTGIPVSIMAYGPEREQVILRKEFF